MSVIYFAYEAGRYRLNMPDHKVKNGNSFRGEHEYFISRENWEFDVRVVIRSSYGKDYATVEIPLSKGKEILVPVEHLGSVMEVLEALAVV
jgi:hypothetical protein